MGCTLFTTLPVWIIVMWHPVYKKLVFLGWRSFMIYGSLQGHICRLKIILILMIESIIDNAARWNCSDNVSRCVSFTSRQNKLNLVQGCCSLEFPPTVMLYSLLCSLVPKTLSEYSSRQRYRKDCWKQRCSISKCGQHKAAASGSICTSLHYLSKYTWLHYQPWNNNKWSSTCISDLDHIECYKSWASSPETLPPTVNWNVITSIAQAFGVFNPVTTMIMAVYSHWTGLLEWTTGPTFSALKISFVHSKWDLF